MKTIKGLLFAALMFAALSVTTRGGESTASDPLGSISVTVIGAVQKPCATKLPQGSTILTALGAAGGWTGGAKVDRVVLLRGDAGKKLDRTEYDLKAILAGTVPAVALRSGDVVYVEEKLF